MKQRMTMTKTSCRSPKPRNLDSETFPAAQPPSGLCRSEVFLVSFGFRVQVTLTNHSHRKLDNYLTPSKNARISRTSSLVKRSSRALGIMDLEAFTISSI